VRTYSTDSSPAEIKGGKRNPREKEREKRREEKKREVNQTLT